MDNITIRNSLQAQSVLNRHAPHISIAFLEKISSLNNLNNLQTLDDLERIVKKLIVELYAVIKNQGDSFDDKLVYICVECYVTTELYEQIFPQMCAHLDKYDRTLFVTCTDMSDRCRMSRESDGLYAIPLTAAIVELANIDAYPSTLEKLSCLCTTYDLVYAELKVALIELREANDSDSDVNVNIPVVESCNMVPLLMTVIVRAKLLHLYSNLYYIQAFAEKLVDDNVTCKIYDDFREAIEKLTEVKNAPIPEWHAGTVMHREVDLMEVVRLTSEMVTSDSAGDSTLLSNQRKRIINLITTATTQHLS